MRAIIALKPAILIGLCAVIFLMVVPESILSNTIVPYEPGSPQTIPGTAARLTNAKCFRTYDGAVYTFDVEVFGACWKPIYSIRFFPLEGITFQPVAWPQGWNLVEAPAHVLASEPIALATQSAPIEPGMKLGGFAMSSHSAPLVFSWYPADDRGNLVGKISKESLECPLSTEPGTWGSIKAMYR